MHTVHPGGEMHSSSVRCLQVNIIDAIFCFDCFALREPDFVLLMLIEWSVSLLRCAALPSTLHCIVTSRHHRDNNPLLGERARVNFFFISSNGVIGLHLLF